MRSRSTVPCLLTVLALALTACGTRVSRALVLRAESGGASAQAGSSLDAGGVAGGSGGVGAGGAALDNGAAGSGGAAATGGVSANGGAATGGSSAGGSSAHGGAAGGGSSAGGPSSGGGLSGVATSSCSKPGPPVVVGQVGGFSGLVGANVQGAIQGSYVWVKDVNARGGLGCHPVQFIQKDDASDPAKSQAEVQDLVENHHAILTFSDWVPLDVAGFRAGTEKEQVAAVGGDQVTPDWHQSPYFFPVGGTERALFSGALKGAANLGRKKVAVLYCVESTACTAFDKTVVKDGYATRFGMQVVYETAVSITQTDFTSQCQNAKNAGADTLVFAGDAAGLARAGRSCASLSYFPTYPIAAVQASFDKSDPNLRKGGIQAASAAFPYTQNDNPAQAAFHAAYQRYAASSPLDADSTTTWAAGKMLELAFQKMGPAAQQQPVTKQMVVNALTQIKGETLGGLIPPTSYTAGQPAPENFCFYPMQFGQSGAFTAPNGSQYQCIQ